MKVTDYIAEFIATQNVQHVFVLQGGAALHLIDSVEKHPSLSAIAMQHEQSSAMAADAYARASQNLGVTMSTSGPGATNLLTGIACSYFDSIPTLHITGNVASFRQSDEFGVRQYGFQETDIVSMAKPVTKYAVRVKTPEDIINELPKALEIAKSGRPGPVLIDIPDDFQRADINIESSEIKRISRKVKMPSCFVDFSDLVRSINQAKRPIIILGAGILNSDSENSVIELLEKIGIPYLYTWPLKGIQDSNARLNLGSFGTHSLRGNNIVLQNSDFILSIGTRLDSRATAKLDTFARSAKIAMIDIDRAEMDKFSKLNKNIDFKYELSCDVFIEQFEQCINRNPINEIESTWAEYINSVRNKFNKLPKQDLSNINPYYAAKTIAKKLNNSDIITVDTGTCLPLTMVYGEEKAKQKYISSYNNTPMGFALPAAIGAHFATGKPITCINGDGGLQMNIQELATIANYNLPIHIWVYNNQGHCMIKQTQDDWLNSEYHAADTKHGLPSVKFTEIAKGYGIKSRVLLNDKELDDVVLESELPYLSEITISPDFRYEPIIKYGNPLENMTPLLPEAYITEHMLIQPIHNKT